MNSEHKKHILAIDTTLLGCACGLYRLEGHRTDLVVESGCEDGQIKSGSLANDVSLLMQRSGCQWENIDGIVVSQGPGSFTGIKIGLAFVQGLAMGLPTQIAIWGVSSLQIAAELLVASLGLTKDQTTEMALAHRATRSKGYLVNWVQGRADFRALDIEVLPDPMQSWYCLGDWPELTTKLQLQSKNIEFLPIVDWQERILAAMAATWNPKLKGQGKGPLDPHYLRLSAPEEKRAEQLASNSQRNESIKL